MIERSLVRVPAGTAGELSSPWSTFCADYYFGIRSTPVLPQQHVKDPGRSAKSAGGRLPLNTHAPYICGFSEMMTECKVCMVCTERAETAAVSGGTSRVTTKQRIHYSVDIQSNSAIKSDSHSFRITFDKSGMSLLESGE